MKSRPVRLHYLAFTLALLGLAVPAKAILFYTFLPHNGAGKAEFSPPRPIDPSAIGVPCGYCIEPVITGGMDNPIDVVFMPGGEPIFSTTFLQYPAAGKRDGLLHAVHGGIYGKEYLDVINPHPWTRPRVMPVLSHLGPAAPAGGRSRPAPDGHAPSPGSPRRA